MSKQKTLLRTKTDFPQGTFVKTESATYLISNNKKLKAISNRIVKSWSPMRIVEVAESAVSHYKEGILPFRQGSLIYSQASGRMYLISGNKALHILSPDVLTRINAKREDAVWVSQEELKIHVLGETIK